MFETIKTIWQLIPIILEIIKIVEKQIPISGKGAEKLQFVKDILIVINPNVADPNIWKAVEKIISSSVNMYNITGVFKK